MERKLIAIVEIQNGTTYEQEIEFVESIEKSIKIAEKGLGKGYMICDTYWTRG